MIERRIALLRGINLGPHKRVAMPALRELLGGAGYGEVRTYLQSGNAVVESAAKPRDLERDLEGLLADEFGFDIGVIVRTAEEWLTVAQRNPLAEVADDPKRYQVTFLAEPLERATLDELASFAADGERFVAHGQELYAWHPAGVARSRLWNKLARLEVKATSRNWSTVTALGGLAAE